MVLDEYIDYSHFQDIKLLCIEDELEVSEWLKSHFSKIVPTVFIARNGKEGLDIFKEHSPDIVLTDIMMPMMSGLDMAREIRKLSLKTKIIIVTAHGDGDSLMDAIDIGVDRFLTKPVSLDKLDRSFLSCAKVIAVEKELAKKKQELCMVENIDSLTALPNRKKLLEIIGNSNSPALAILNIDSFKEINDFYGHTVGDMILCELARRLSRMGEAFGVYKLSADEYAVFKECSNREEFCESVEELIEKITQDVFAYDENEISISFSAGIALSTDSLLAKADMALKEAKRSKRQFVIYDEALKLMEVYSSNLTWSRELRSAIRENRILPFYQAIVDNKTKEIKKYECLVRMVDGVGGNIAPHYFLDISKKNRIYPKITKKMVDSTFDMFAHTGYEFSVNICVEDMLDPITSKYIYQKLAEYEDKIKVTFEILESEKIETYDEVRAFIDIVKSMGAKISIDDFGSGYSNFEHILRLNVDYIKIDASMIKNIDSDKNSQIIVETIVGFAKKLDIKTIAEYVHTEAVYNKVRELGVDMSQGFYFSPPIQNIKR